MIVSMILFVSLGLFFFDELQEDISEFFEFTDYKKAELQTEHAIKAQERIEYLEDKGEKIPVSLIERVEDKQKQATENIIKAEIRLDIKIDENIEQEIKDSTSSDEEIAKMINQERLNKINDGKSDYEKDEIDFIKIKSAIDKVSSTITLASEANKIRQIVNEVNELNDEYKDGYEMNDYEKEELKKKSEKISTKINNLESFQKYCNKKIDIDELMESNDPYYILQQNCPELSNYSMKQAYQLLNDLSK